MGCNQSKIETEEAIACCKEQKRFMTDAVSTRNAFAFAAAHSAYTTSLKNIGAALGNFAHNEVQNPQFPTTTTTTENHSFQRRPNNPLRFLSLLSSPRFLPDPLQHAASMPEIKFTKPIIEEDEEEENEGSLRKRRSNRNTNGSVGGGGGNSRRVVEEEEETPPLTTTKQPKSDPVNHQHQHQHHHHAVFSV